MKDDIMELLNTIGSSGPDPKERLEKEFYYHFNSISTMYLIKKISETQDDPESFKNSFIVAWDSLITINLVSELLNPDKSEVVMETLDTYISIFNKVRHDICLGLESEDRKLTKEYVLGLVEEEKSNDNNTNTDTTAT